MEVSEDADRAGLPARSDDSAADRLNEGLRAWYAAFGELARQFGLHLSMHSSDAAALIQITNAEERGDPLTPAELARRVGLTAAATSSLLNRLEGAGLVERRRDRADRRVVSLRSTPTVHDEVHTFFSGVGADLGRVAARYPAEALSGFADLIQEMTGVLETHLDRMIEERS